MTNERDVVRNCDNAEISRLLGEIVLDMRRAGPEHFDELDDAVVLEAAHRLR